MEGSEESEYKAESCLCLGCYTVIPWTRGLVNSTGLFVIVPEAGGSRTKVQAGSVSAEDPLPRSQVHVFSLCPHMAEKVRELSGVSSIKTLIPFLRVSPP